MIGVRFDSSTHQAASLRFKKRLKQDHQKTHRPTISNHIQPDRFSNDSLADLRCQNNQLNHPSIIDHVLTTKYPWLMRPPSTTHRQVTRKTSTGLLVAAAAHLAKSIPWIPSKLGSGACSAAGAGWEVVGFPAPRRDVSRWGTSDKPRGNMVKHRAHFIPCLFHG